MTGKRGGCKKFLVVTYLDPLSGVEHQEYPLLRNVVGAAEELSRTAGETKVDAP